MSNPIPRKKLPSLETLEGYRWVQNGQSNYSGNLLRLYQALDALFISWSREVQAEEHQFPIFIQAKELKKLDYFRSFPHLITFAACLDPSEENLKAYTETETLDANGAATLTKLTPICDCLTPAACYHFYITFQGRELHAPLYLTTRANCFRRETHYIPLQRQWNFGMREIVCVGTSDEVKAFLEKYRKLVGEFFEGLKFPIQWLQATDPFFDPSRNPKYLMQRLDPVKHEMIYEGELSIGSINFHRNYFGEAFKISRGGEDAYSGCVAFGMDRWIFALLNEYGPNAKDWPEEIQKRLG